MVCKQLKNYSTALEAHRKQHRKSSHLLTGRGQSRTLTAQHFHKLFPKNTKLSASAQDVYLLTACLEHSVCAVADKVEKQRLEQQLIKTENHIPTKN